MLHTAHALARLCACATLLPFAVTVDALRAMQPVAPADDSESGAPKVPT